jgi:hypothetical protein
MDIASIGSVQCGSGLVPTDGFRYYIVESSSFNCALSVPSLYGVG